MCQYQERPVQLGQKDRVSSHSCAGFFFFLLEKIFLHVLRLEPRALHMILLYY